MSDIAHVLGQAMDRHRAGNLTEAARLYGEVLAVRPDHAVAACNLAGISRVREQWNEALEYYTRALDQQPAMNDALIGRALCHQALGDLEASARDCEAIIANDREHVVSWVNLGLNQLLLGRPADAERAFLAALEIRPGMVDARLNLATALRLQERHADAVEQLRRCISEQPDNANAHCLLGAALFEQGRRHDALRSLTRALQINPFDRRALAYQSVLLPELGQYAEASRLVDFEHLLWIVRPGEPREGAVALSAADAAELNGAIASHVLSHPTLVHERAGNTTRFGAHTGNLLLGEKGPCARLEALINARVSEYFAHLPRSAHHQYLAWQPDSWRLSVWAVVMDSGGYQEPHIHAEGWLSGVYYVKIPAAVGQDNAGREGCLEFGRGVASLGCEDETLIKYVRPEAGLMVLFPSYYYHRTIPFHSDEQRICVAFDVRPVVDQETA